jgi:Zn-dependent peptidase ImmA (M78 family)
VSREVILRKLLDRRLINQEYYETKAEEWIKAYEEGRKHDRGGSYYATQATYLGDRFLRLAFSRYYQGRCTVEQLADYLNVKVNSVAGLEHYMWGKALSR